MSDEMVPVNPNEIDFHQDLDSTAQNIAKAFRTIESGGNYNASSRDEGHGAYQFEPATWSQWSKEYTGKTMARPMVLPMTPENQDAVAVYKIRDYLAQGHSPSEIASMWNSNHPDWEGRIGTNKYGVAYDVPRHVAKFETAYYGGVQSPDLLQRFGKAIKGILGPSEVQAAEIPKSQQQEGIPDHAIDPGPDKPYYLVPQTPEGYQITLYSRVPKKKPLHPNTQILGTVGQDQEVPIEDINLFDGEDTDQAVQQSTVQGTPVPFEDIDFTGSGEVGQPGVADKVVSDLGQSFVNYGAEAAKVFNSSMAGFSDTLAKASEFVARKTGLPAGGIFDEATQVFNSNARYWNTLIKNPHIVQEVVGGAAGGAIPGVVNFEMGVPWAALEGYTQGGAEGMIKGIVKRMAMGTILKAAQSLGLPSRVASTAGAGAADAYSSGASPEEIGKAAATMGVMAAAGGPGGKSARKAVQDFRETLPKRLQDDAGAIAWHGSPHDFDRFSTRGMGSGEGAQAYGWGLYFAEKKEIAEYYRHKLSPSKDTWHDDIWEEAVDQINDHIQDYSKKELTPSTLKRIAEDAAGFAEANAESRSARKFAERLLGKVRGLYESKFSLVDSKVYYDGKPYAEAMDDRGQLYKVDVPEDNRLMLWDKPLSEQHEAVQESLDSVLRNHFSEDDIEYLEGNWDNGQIEGKDFYKALSEELGSDNAASKALNSAGIKGHKFLDATSRAEGEGSYNYVIYDDSAIKLIDKPYKPGFNPLYDQSGSIGKLRNTDYPTFKKWFGDSKVVDEAGKPLVVYHGTDVEGIEVFHDNSHFGTIEQVSDILRRKSDISAMFGRESNASVYPVYLSIRNPMRIQDGMDIPRNMEIARREGYDGLVYKNWSEGVNGDIAHDSFVPMRPNQIKSVFNQGTWDSANPNISGFVDLPGMWDELLRWSAPTMRGEDAYRAGRIISENESRMARKMDIFMDRMKEADSEFLRMSEDDSLTFMQRMDTGLPQDSPELQGVADVLKQMFDQRTAEIQALGTGALDQVRENYFPHIWEKTSVQYGPSVKGIERASKMLDSAEVDLLTLKSGLEGRNQRDATIKDGSPTRDVAKLDAIAKREARLKTIEGKLKDISEKRAELDKQRQELDEQKTKPVAERLKSAVANTFARRPLEGSKSFTKARVWDDVYAGISQGAEPVSYNPLDLAALKLAEMDKYIFAHKSFQALRQTGDMKFIKASESIPKGWEKIQDRYGTVRRPVKDAQGNTVGFVDAGYYIAKDPVAQVINNYLSQTLYNSKYFGSFFKAYMGAANNLNMFQLGMFSAFHAGFTSLESVISNVSVGIRQASQGRIGDAINTLYKASAGFVTNPLLGKKVLQEWKFPGSQNAAIANIVEGIQLGGGKFGMDTRFTTNHIRKMLQDWNAGTVKGKIKAVAHSPFALCEASTIPILKWLVPSQKAGLFAHMAQDWYNTHPNATYEETSKAMRQIWNRVDSRLGQVVYNRLFTHNVAKNVSQALMRAPGWKGGSAVEFGGAVKDLGEQFVKMAKGERPELTDRMSYVLAIGIVSAAINGIVTAALTGEKPHDMDFVAFRTGRKDKNGNDVRFVSPSYLKDLYAYTQKGFIEPILSSTNPLFNLGVELYRNKDYYGVEVRHPDDNKLEQGVQVAQHLLKSFTPFWMRGVQKANETYGTPTAEKALPLFGFSPASGEYTKSRAQLKASEFLMERMPIGSRTKEQFDQSQIKADLKARIRVGDRSAEKDLKEAIQEGKLPQTALEDIRKSLYKNVGTKQTPVYIKKSPFMELVDRLKADEAMKVFELSTPKERSEIRGLLLRKVGHSKVLSRQDKNRFWQILKE